MKKLYLSVFSILAFVFLTACIEEGYNDYSTADKEVCETAGGTYKEFSDSCGDSCTAMARHLGGDCKEALEYACDCGIDMCWNGTVCKANPHAEWIE